ILIFAGLSYVLGETTAPALVDRVMAGSAAERAGFQKGDVIRSVEGQPIGDFAELVRFVALRPGETLTFVVERDGAEATLTATPLLVAVDTPAGPQHIGRLGLGATTDPIKLTTVHPTPLGAVWSGVKQSATIISVNAEYIWRLGRGKVTPD